MCGFGCLKNLVFLVLLSFAIIGFVASGAWDFCVEKYNEMQGDTGKKVEITSLSTYLGKGLSQTSWGH